jgi:hypothetical protein
VFGRSSLPLHFAERAAARQNNATTINDVICFTSRFIVYASDRYFSHNEVASSAIIADMNAVSIDLFNLEIKD